VFVCSVPKAGTYLLAEILQEMGLENTRLHLSPTALTDYRFCTRSEARRDYLQLLRPVPLNRALDMMLPGQFSVGHLDYSPEIVSALNEFRVLFVRRNIRDCLISFMRWEESTGRDPERTRDWAGMPDGPDKTLVYLRDLGSQFLQWSQGIIGWAECAQAEQVTFEGLWGDYGEAHQVSDLKRIFRFCEIAASEPERSAMIRRVMGAETMTWSGARTNNAIFWDDRVERAFVELGGVAINRALGYPEPGAAVAGDSA
jgi:hypothetical protein